VGVYRGRVEGQAMMEAETLRRDIEGKLASIRLAWIERAKALSPADRAEIRRFIELHLDDLKDLISH
jgi:hypothetical protein